jgi:uncharacterized protein
LAVFIPALLKSLAAPCAVNFNFKPAVFDAVSEAGPERRPGDDLFKLGMMYSAGSGGCPMDRVSAHMIFNLAAMKGSIEARVYRREMSQEMEREEIAEAQKAARRYIDAGVVRLAA